MAVRVSQRMMFNNFVGNMNMTLTELMDMNIQAASQKKVNRPSDDPAGAARIMRYRSRLSTLNQYRTNIDTAQGWLNQADQTLVQVNSVLTRIKELAQQAATGTMSQDNREQVGYEVRQLYEQLITLANSEYEGNHIFAGHKIEDPAYVQGLGITVNDANISGSYSIQGSADYTNLVQFLSSGAVGGVADLDYRVSKDGGRSWVRHTLAAGDTTLDLGGVRVTMEPGGTVRAVDPNNVNETNNGSWMWVRPTAVYQGDDVDTVLVDEYGVNNLQAQASGSFPKDVMVRIDNTSAVNLDEEIEYSYSTDRGITWVSGNTVHETTAASNTTLVVPGGILDLYTAGPTGTLEPGNQFIIRPRRAEINFEISTGEEITVNNVGKDIFGGIYFEPCASNASCCINTLSNASHNYDCSADNMFETVGKLVGYIETNNQAGIQQALEGLGESSVKVMTAAANVGARENRLDTADSVLSSLEMNVEERMSTIEDVDVASLMTKLAQQQLVYETVLKSSSMVMRLSLANFI